MALSACANFYPNEKVASYDPETGMTLPHPCPDWSQSQTSNYLNANHSNFGCAVNRNSALQLDDPNDMVMGHGDKNPDTGITSGVITRYRAGELPVPLVPVQGSDSGGE
ncbi:MAG: CpaD family pilus assembly lipoprotein [Rickettsiales bacterium]